MFPLRLLLPLLAALFFGGCVSPPPPSYLTIDQTSPDFRTAVDREIKRLTAEGKTVKEAEKLARQLILDRFTARAERRRSNQVSPLVKALQAAEQKHGCWTFVATTTTRVAGKPPTVVVERFDASQIEDRLWTLISRDGAVPDEKAQAAYRKTKLRAWKKSLANPDEPESMQAGDEAMNGELDIATDAATHQTTYAISQGASKMFLVMNWAGYQKTYTLDDAGRMLRRTEKALGTASVAAGSMKIEHYETVTDYALVDPALPPFVVRTWQKARGKIFGVDTSEQEEETVYSDYRRVTCNEDRFQVIIGPPQMTEFQPAGK